ncbi:T9SS type A sorting domain-containing protein [Chryseobacterium sp. YIM B08800]|uniref:T9SS type A sorting domain-containing protein n=1 Tax=Chryseobacterium sp. YIM B08800 TaxID=2984136 RepID=UPI00223FECA2|nr:T9SS type A sorting domain-containing protein [Chryseobacterium sp. YIM B08800]
MRTKLLFLFIGSTLFGQNADLFNNDWYISQIVMNGQTTATPAMNINLERSLFYQSGTPNSFSSKYFNSAVINMNFSTIQDSFISNGGACTLMQYVGTNQTAVRDYDQKNCDFYLMNSPTGSVFNYEIVNNSSSKTLIITKVTTGDKIYYNNSFLGTKENTIKKTFKLYPNPSTDFVIIENVEKNLKLKINDLSGKILFETLTSDKTLKIDVSSFAAGQYILSIENFKPEIFIKK